MSSNQQQFNRYNSGHDSAQLTQRCASPLVLFNNVPPSFETRPRSPQVSASPAKFRTEPEARADFNQLPKRTTSLGPQRRLASPFFSEQDQPPATSYRDQYRRDSNSGLQRANSFKKAANELQSSLTELNKLIDLPEASSQTMNRPPRYSSYISKGVEAQPLQAQHVISPSPPDSPELPTGRADLLNWKASSSIGDLRSMFEQSQSARLDQASSNLLNVSTLQRPPRAPSPNILHKSPWKDLDASQSQPDYTIRRTISTSSRSQVSRNPYRSYYGN